MQNCVGNENNTRQEMKRMLQELHAKSSAPKKELLEEKIKTTDMEQRIRELEIQLFQETSSKSNAVNME